MLFARGVILVEGDAERFLLPVFAETMGKQLDNLGITVCSVAGVNFQPYVRFLAGLGIPFAVVTDWDPGGQKVPLGYNRALRLVSTIVRVKTGKIPTKLIGKLKALDDYNQFSDKCEEFGVFTNSETLEVDLFRDGFAAAIIETLRETKFGEDRKTWIDEMEADPDDLEAAKLLSLIDSIGKGRFAQRLSTRIEGMGPPAYIKNAIEFVAAHV